MTREQKDLLLKDLCSRLPYKIKSSFYGEIEECETWDTIEGIDIYNLEPKVYIGVYYLNIEDIKPYLFPLSSMTEEQKEEHKDLLENQYNFDANGNVFTLQDFYNKYHFDYRGLIDMGLAIDATRLNIY